MVPDFVQEEGIKTIPNKKKCKEARWLPQEALQRAEKRRDTKGKKRKGKVKPFACRLPKEQGEIRKLSSVISAKK